MPVLDHAEAAAVAALMKHLRFGSALPVRRPSYTAPTLLSRPITCTKAIPLTPTPATQQVPSPAWTQILTWRAPVQYFSVIDSYAYSTAEGLTTPGVQFKLQLNGNDLASVSASDGSDPCRDALWPLQRRPIHLVLSQNDVLTLIARNLGVLPQTVVAGFWGWSYNTTDIEFSDLANKGITDA